MLGATGQILSGFGLSAASGLNAYIPLLLVGLAGRLGLIQLSSPFDLLSNEFVLATLVVLLLIETFVDKVPGLDHLNDLIQTLIRPTAGAILFAANAHVITNLHPVVAFILGLIVAFGVHATKATARPVVTAGTLGTGNWLVSLLEDIVSFVLSVAAILSPILLILLAGLFVLLFWRWMSRRRNRPSPAAPSPAAPPLRWP